MLCRDSEPSPKFLQILNYWPSYTQVHVFNLQPKHLVSEQEAVNCSKKLLDGLIWQLVK